MQQAFIQYLKGKGLVKSTQQRYIRDVGMFLQSYKKDIRSCTRKEVLAYFDHLEKEKRWSQRSIGCILTSLNHWFHFLVSTKYIAYNPCTGLKIKATKNKTAYYIYSPEELSGLYDAYHRNYVQDFDDSSIPYNMRLRSSLSKQRNYVMLGFLVFQGLATKELHKIKVADIDIVKACVSIAGDLQSNARTIPLKPSQIVFLTYYINVVRPQILQAGTRENGMLLLPLPEHARIQDQQEQLKGSIQTLAAQLKILDRHFMKIQQLRVSVITNWLNAEGLHKAQYYAGHRYSSTTKQYVADNAGDPAINTLKDTD